MKTLIEYIEESLLDDIDDLENKSDNIVNRSLDEYYEISTTYSGIKKSVYGRFNDSAIKKLDPSLLVDIGTAAFNKKFTKDLGLILGYIMSTPSLYNDVMKVFNMPVNNKYQTFSCSALTKLLQPFFNDKIDVRVSNKQYAKIPNININILDDKNGDAYINVILKNK